VVEASDYMGEYTHRSEYLDAQVAFDGAYDEMWGRSSEWQQGVEDRMTADSELFVDETVCELLEKKIRGLIPRGCRISLEVPSGWWGVWDASEFPDRGEADANLYAANHKVERFGKVSWDTKFTVEDYGGPSKCIKAWPVKLKFKVCDSL
jgi:hypothetical protein